MRITKVAVALSVINCAVAAFAAEYVWDGGAGDGKWSSAANWNPDGVPGKDDDVVFNASSGSATVDEGFGGEVMRLTLAEGYAGTVTLGREFTVAHTFTHGGGTFTCGDNDFSLGPVKRTSNKQNYLGNWYQTGGVFNAPSDKAMLTHLMYRPGASSGSNDLKLMGGTWNANGGTFRILQDHDVNSRLIANVFDKTFYNLEIADLYPGQKKGSGGRMSWWGTNTVVNSFTHRYATFWNGTATPTFKVLGDYYVGGNAASGDALVKMVGTGDQKVIGDGMPYSSIGLWVDKPSGSVKFEGTSITFDTASKGCRFLSSTTIDMSELETFTCPGNGGTVVFWMDNNAHLIAPQNFIFDNRQWGLFKCRDQVFNNLTFKSTEYGVNWPNGCTNWVKGTYTVNSSVSSVKYTDICNSGSAGVIIPLGDVVITNSLTSSGGSGGNVLMVFTNGVDQTIHLGNGKRVAVPQNMYVRKEDGSRLVLAPNDGRAHIGNWGGQMDCVLSIESGVFDLSLVKELIFTNAQNTVFRHLGGEFRDPGVPITYVSCTNPRIGPLQNPIAALTNKCAGAIAIIDKPLVVTNAFVCCGGKSCWYSGKDLVCQGDYIIDSALSFSGASFFTGVQFTGDKDQVIRVANPNMNNWGTHTVDKTGGRLILASDYAVTNDASCNGGYEHFYWTKGTIDLNGHDLCLGSYPHIRVDARAVIPAGSHLRIKGNLNRTGDPIDIASGATLAFELPAGEQDEPMVQVRTSIAQQNPFNLEVLPKVSVDAPRTWKVLSYGSTFTGFDAKKWSVTGPDEFRRPRVSHDTDEKLILLNWKYKTGLCVFVR